MLLDLSDTISKPYDLFISHASEDKESFVRELATALAEKGLSIWYDEFTLTLGDPLRESIDKGLAESRFGIVVLSPAYFAKTWTKNELGGLFAIETAGKKSILPVWHNFSAQEMQEKSPMLTDRIGVSSSQGVPYVVLKILEAIGKGVAPRIETLPRLGKLSGVPELPKKFLPRPGELEALKERLLAKEKNSVGLTGKSEKVGVHGMGGIGKSVLAAAAARDEEVRKAFPNGIIWVALGQEPQLTLRQQDVLERAGGEKREFKDAEQGKGVLEDFFREKSCLLIVDDIWDSQHAKLFNVVGRNGKLLITTRDKDVLLAINAKEHRLDVLDEERALEMLSLWSGEKELQQEAIGVAKHCGGLPLALAVSGARVKEDGILWSDVLAALKEAELEFLDHPQGNVLGAIESSVSVLKEKDRYFDLAVFFEEAQIPEPTLIIYWMHQGGLKERDSRALIGKLEKRALIRSRGEAPNRKIFLHDLQQDYVQKRGANLSLLHAQLVDAYGKVFVAWETGKNDGYYFQQLPKHLKEAGRDEELRKLLLNFNWIDAKLEATDVVTLIADYELLGSDPVISLLRSALENSAHVLRKDRRQLPSQLVGRLLTRQEPEICDLLVQARRWRKEIWLEPITPCLHQAGGALVRTLQGHANSVISVIFSPNGKQILSGALDNTMKIWDRESGKELRTLKGHAHWVASVAFSPDGKQILSGSRDKTMRIWDQESGKELRTLQGHASWITSVSFSPDGKQLLSASEDKTVKIWDRESGKDVRTLRGHTSAVTSVAFSPDGKQILSGSRDKTVKIWDRESGKELRTLRGHARSVTSVAFSPDGKQILSGSGDHTVRVWDGESGKEAHTLQGHADSVTSVAFSPDGKQILSGSYDKTVKIWDRQSGKVRTFQGHASWITSISFSPDGKQILSGSYDKTLKIWDREIRNEVCFQDAHATWVSSPASSLDAKQILSGSRDKTVKTWDRESGKEVYTLLQGHARSITSAVLSPDGKQILSGSRDKTVRIWDRESGKEVHKLEGHARSVTSVAFSPDGKQILSGSGDHTVKIWDRESGKEVHTLQGHARSITSVAFSPDGKQILSGSRDNTVKIWDRESGNEVCTLQGHTRSITSVAFSPDGKQILSGSRDQTVKIWDQESGKEVVTFVADAPITSCAMERDLIVAADNRGQIYRLRLHLKHASTSA